MAGLDYVNRSELAALARRIRKLETDSPLGNAAIDRGALRVLSEEGLIVIGSQRISGRLIGDGTFVWDGGWALKGTGEIVGDATLTSNIDVVDDGSISVGNVEIRDGKITVGVGGNTITIDGTTGRIVAGALTIDPSARGGSVKFAGGPEIYANGAELDLYSSSLGAYITLNNTAAELHGPGARFVRLTSTGIQTVGRPTRVSSQSNNAPVGTVWSDISGNEYRVIAG